MSEQIVIVGLKRICAICGCGRNTIYDWIERESFPAWKKCGVWRAVPEEVKVWMSEQRKKI
jgi:predicted DNA-binding transcriptional regulator AlpA